MTKNIVFSLDSEQSELLKWYIIKKNIFCGRGENKKPIPRTQACQSIVITFINETIRPLYKKEQEKKWKQ